MTRFHNYAHEIPKGTGFPFPTQQIELAQEARYDLDSDFVEAENRLYGRIKEIDYNTPCSQNPNKWAQREVGQGETLDEYTDRVRNVRRICHGCEVFVECSLLAASVNPADPEIVGILAGQLIVRSFRGNYSAQNKINSLLEKEDSQ